MLDTKSIIALCVMIGGLVAEVVIGIVALIAAVAGTMDEPDESSR